MIVEHFIIASLVFFLFITLRNLVRVTQESYKHSDRANRYYLAIDDLDRWCRYDLPETEVIAKYLISKGEGLSCNAGTPVDKEACTISGLREQIRKMKNDR